jgi:hypothetical protein
MRNAIRILAVCIAGVMMPGYQAVAEVAESYKCKMKAGVSREQLAEMGETYIGVGESKNFTDFKLSILFPMYSDDISTGTFFWNGTSTTMTALEQAIAIWEGPDNSEAQTLWLQYVEGCESASLFSAVTIN